MISHYQARKQKHGPKQDGQIENTQKTVGNRLVRIRLVGPIPIRGLGTRANHGAVLPSFTLPETNTASLLPQVAVYGQTFGKNEFLNSRENAIVVTTTRP